MGSDVRLLTALLPLLIVGRCGHGRTEGHDVTRRVAVVSNAAGYVGPNLCRLLAERGHDLVIGDVSDGLVEELAKLGAAVEVVNGVQNLSRPESSARLVEAAVSRFGRIDSATAFTGGIVVGRFL